ncbi:MAG TPA: hypothetical protein VGQ81_00720, partial [Acidobacteriota bacterium]|nr:hypothetical protein [Acidobacteriota bacterium]
PETAQASRRRGSTSSDQSDEEEEEKPSVTVTILDASGHAVRKLEGPTTAGLHRVTWDLAYPSSILGSPAPTERGEEAEGRRPRPRSGPKVLPGTFQARLEVDGKEVATTSLQVTTEGLRTMTAEERGRSTDFLRQLSDAEGAAYGALQTANRLQEELSIIERAVAAAPSAPASLGRQVRDLIQKNKKVVQALRGKERPQENDPPSISGRISSIAGDLRLAGAPPTETHRRELERSRQMLGDQLKVLQALLEKDLPDLNKQLDAAGVSWTPGRMPKI